MVELGTSSGENQLGFHDQNPELLETHFQL